MTDNIIQTSFGPRPKRRRTPPQPTPAQRLYGLMEDLYAYVDSLPRHQQAEARLLANRLEDIADTFMLGAPQ